MSNLKQALVDGHGDGLVEYDAITDTVKMPFHVFETDFKRVAAMRKELRSLRAAASDNRTEGTHTKAERAANVKANIAWKEHP